MIVKTNYSDSGRANFSFAGSVENIYGHRLSEANDAGLAMTPRGVGQGLTYEIRANERTSQAVSNRLEGSASQPQG